MGVDNQQPINHNFGIYNFSNEGQCSWYDFAKKIFEVNNIQIDLKAIPTSSFPTPAQRPAFSVLDKSKIKNTFALPDAVKGTADSMDFRRAAKSNRLK